MPKAQKSSLLGSELAVSEIRADSPLSLGPPASLLQLGQAVQPRSHQVEPMVAVPEEGSFGNATGLGGCSSTAGNYAGVVDTIAVAIGSTERAKIGDGVMGKVGVFDHGWLTRDNTLAGSTAQPTRKKSAVWIS